MCLNMKVQISHVIGLNHCHGHLTKKLPFFSWSQCMHRTCKCHSNFSVIFPQQNLFFFYKTNWYANLHANFATVWGQEIVSLSVIQNVGNSRYRWMKKPIPISRSLWIFKFTMTLSHTLQNLHSASNRCWFENAYCSQVYTVEISQKGILRGKMWALRNKVSSYGVNSTDYQPYLLFKNLALKSKIGVVCNR